MCDMAMKCDVIKSQSWITKKRFRGSFSSGREELLFSPRPFVAQEPIQHTEGRKILKKYHESPLIYQNSHFPGVG